MKRALSPAVAVSIVLAFVELGAGRVAEAQQPATPAKAEKEMGPGVGLTVYNANFAVIKERRELDLAKGVGEIKFTDVAKTIDPTSVHFLSLTDPSGVEVLDQNYEYDLVNPDKILEKYIDKEITLVLPGAGADKSSTVKGTLQGFVSTSYETPGSLTLLVNGGTRIIGRNGVQDIQFGALPAGLVTRPTLVWKTQSDKGGKHLVKVSYMADEVNWEADYTAVLNAKETGVDLSGWVTITNKSGARYVDAQLKLIAGDVRREDRRPKVERGGGLFGGGEEKTAAAVFKEHPFGDYHMYTLPRPTTINDNQVKQIQLIEPAAGVPVRKFYEYRPRPEATKARILIEFANKKEDHLGIALPRGTVRVYKRDETDGSLEFIGEGWIDHTAKDEKATLYIGDAFDIACEFKEVKIEDHTRDSAGWFRGTFEVEIRNHKAEPIEVRVVPVIGINGKIEAETIDGQKAEHKEKDAYTVEYRVKVAKDGKAKLSYTVFQSR